MRALDPEVVDAVWAAVEPLIPEPPEHTLGCHRPRISDRTCFEAILIRLVTGSSWETTEQLVRGAVSDTTLRARRDDWTTAGVFDTLAEEALAAYDRIIELDLSDAALDGSQHKAPAGGDGTGPNPTDRGRQGWKWSLLCDRAGIPIGWAADGANRHDFTLLAPTHVAAGQQGLLNDIETLHMDRGYDYDATRATCVPAGLDDLNIVARRRSGTAPATKRAPLGMRWSVECTNARLANFGQLRRNTDRRPIHRLGQLVLAISLLLAAKLIDWRNHWTPDVRPIH